MMDGVEQLSAEEAGAFSSGTLATIACCLCGTSIEPNPSNMCVSCLRAQVDITEGIPKELAIYYCRNCGRYLQPPKAWIAAELESPELLTLCIKRLKGLSRVKLVDAGFRWTEPHSRRINVRLTIQKEVFARTILQQEFIVVYTVLYQQCDACKRDAAKIEAWQAVVQARQKVDHKRTFYYLEQLLLKHGAHQDALGIKETGDGIDFYFANRSHAVKLLAFLGDVVPLRHKSSEHLVTHDTHNNTYNYKYSFSAEIAPVCRDDLVVLPPKLSNSMGGIGPLVLVSRVSASVSLVDPTAVRTAELPASAFWKTPFAPIMTSRALTEYTVLDIETTGETAGRFAAAEVTVARSSDLGVNDSTVLVRSHLGHVLHIGDLVSGYDVRSAIYNDSLVAGHKASFELPDVVLVRKTYPRRNRARGRKWRLARLAVEMADDDTRVARGAAGVRDPATRDAEQREVFLQELEQDAELRSNVNLYRADDVAAAAAATAPDAAAMTDTTPVDVAPEAAVDADEDDVDGYPEVPLEELLDALDISPPAGGEDGDGEDGDDGGDDADA
ncbi:hypothetical protein I4F81_004660 [Pyropia yezoensis]|uniref:Uncharacterized protein n=1 Tax=Pyropia yezoensis TaxID=2788 RepID=A0ACC3BVP3_PYRYE|nr:hypothetical protein I4F81_004660 [Neopyropia yezoensis]|eukprot:contig_11812_g2811